MGAEAAWGWDGKTATLSKVLTRSREKVEGSIVEHGEERDLFLVVVGQSCHGEGIPLRPAALKPRRSSFALETARSPDQSAASLPLEGDGRIRTGQTFNSAVSVTGS